MVNMNHRLEGNGAARMIQMMKKFGFNVDVQIHVAKVTSIAPLKFKIPGDSFEIGEDEVVYVLQHLLPNKREVVLNGSKAVIEFGDDYLKNGDEVMVIVSDDNQKYFVIDKVVS